MDEDELTPRGTAEFDQARARYVETVLERARHHLRLAHDDPVRAGAMFAGYIADMQMSIGQLEATVAVLAVDVVLRQEARES